MKTRIRVTGTWGGFRAFELKGLKYIPRAGEHFWIDEKKYKEQAETIEKMNHITGKVCSVAFVAHDFRDNIHDIEIHLHCEELKE